jgi:hypothetical protein
MRKIVRFGIGAATCVAFSACSALLPKPPKREGCYPVNEDKAALYAEQGIPILLVGGKNIVCTCYQGSSINKADEEGSLAKADEEGSLAKADEEGSLAKADEEDSLAKADEKSFLVGDFSKLSCRIVPECSGFQVTGYAPKQIKILTETGQKSVPTSCVTW